MATQSAFLKLTLPVNNEFQNTWDQPMNANFNLIDAFADAISSEIVAARFGKPSLSDFLSVAHNPDGTVLPAAEVVAARNSFTYGYRTGAGNAFLLNDRLNAGDREIFDAREGYPALRDSNAFRALSANMVLAGSANGNGYPTWLGYTAATAQIDGTISHIWMQVNGYLGRIRTLQSVVVSGASGTYYLYGEYVSGGVQTVNGNTSSGTTGSDGSDVRIFQDLTRNFLTSNVQIGDVLTISGAGTNAGQYQITAIGPSPANSANQLQIAGYFPGGSQSSLNYTIKDPMAMTIGFSATKTPVTGRFYFAEVDFDGSAITADRAIAFKDYFIGDWRAVDVLTGGGDFEEIWNHNLFDDALEISIQVCQVNDGTQPIQELSVSSGLKNTLGLSAITGPVFSAGTFNPGSSGATYNPLPSLTGGYSASITGNVVADSGIKAKWTHTTINVKNLINAVLYTDYAGVVKTSGYIRVVMKKRRT